MFDLQARQVDRKYKGHANASSQAYARLSSDGRYVISGSEDHNIYVWSVAQDNAATVATHPNSDHIRRVKGSNAAPPPASPTAPSNSSTKTQDNIFGSLFTRRKTTVGAAEGSSELPAQHAEGENPGEWESLDGRVEEKSIYEYFPAHDAAVSAALFAPASTLQYLAAHDDPILSRRKMRTTNGSGEVENLLAPQSNATFGSRDASIGPPTASEDNLVEDTTAIIVSADTSGNIRVFRKDINVQHTYMQDNASRASLLLKHRGSRSSLRDRISQHSRSVSSEIGGLAATATASRHHNHRTETALQSILAVSSESVQPRSATGLGEENKPAKTSFWSKLSRRKSLGSRRIPGLVHQSQTISGNVVASTVTPALLAGGSRARKTIRDGAHSDGEVEDSSVCEYCGHHGFVEFDVSTPKADTFSKPAAPKLAVCENCKRVKNMPV
ncbi:hypothetical protein FBU59_004815 [Linderina macrospora]|uniref:Uncharacterized protein n=1 Tax=Linderina macrospora TaxID=4868 RepID=A0ACC1J4H2_9FUNG|nr:hypothetical protein FBU59_004815 [Linderina macrospora]